MTNFGAVVAQIVPILSFTQESPVKEVVFVPECGGRWGKTSFLQFAMPPLPPEDVEGSGVVYDDDVYHKFHGWEVTEQVKDNKGNVVCEGYDFVCFLGTFVVKTEESEQNGSANEITKVTTITHRYMDAKPWMRANNNADGSHVVSEWGWNKSLTDGVD